MTRPRPQRATTAGARSNVRPRWQTPLPETVVGSWGPLVSDWATAELRINLDRWQRRAVNRALAYDAGYRLVHRVYLISTARQNGKTALVRAIIGWALTAAYTPDWTRILGLAHDRGQARIPYEAVLDDLQDIRRRAPRSLRLTRYLGIRSDLYGRHREYHTGSKESRNAIRGTSNDLNLFDEIRTQRDHGTWSALEPTTRARPDPITVGISTAGDDRSILLREWWERGIRIIDGAEPARGFGMTWYAAPDDAAPDDPRAVLAANPSAAEGRVPLQPILDSIATLSTVGYRQESLNLWSDGGDEWLPPGTWPRQIGLQPATGARIVFGVEAVPTWRRASVIVAIATDAGVWVGVADEIDASRSDRGTVSPQDLVDMLAGLLKAGWKPAAIAFSSAAAAAQHVQAWAEAARIAPLGLTTRQIREASRIFRSELIGGRLTHGPDALLAQQVRVARPSSSIEGGDWYLSIRDSLGEVDAIRSAVWATWAAIAPEARQAAPQVFLPK